VRPLSYGAKFGDGGVKVASQQRTMIGTGVHCRPVTGNACKHSGVVWETAISRPSAADGKTYERPRAHERERRMAPNKFAQRDTIQLLIARHWPQIDGG
jgi:hypothetical protein